jgi:hypothetical protein
LHGYSRRVVIAQESNAVQLFPKLAVTLVALAFVGATVANSGAFAESTSARKSQNQTVLVAQAAPATGPAALNTETQTATLPAQEAPPQGMALFLAGLACIVFLAGRRSRR